MSVPMEHFCGFLEDSTAGNLFCLGYPESKARDEDLYLDNSIGR